MDRIQFTIRSSQCDTVLHYQYCLVPESFIENLITFKLFYPPLLYSLVFAIGHCIKISTLFTSRIFQTEASSCPNDPNDCLDNRWLFFFLYISSLLTVYFSDAMNFKVKYFDLIETVNYIWFSNWKYVNFFYLEIWF